MILILGAVVLGLSLLIWVVGGAIIGNAGYYSSSMKPSTFLDSILPPNLRGAPLWVKVTSPMAVVGSVAGVVLLIVGLLV